MEHLLNVLKGIVLGVANAIPGISGGTMAVVMGIYDKLIDAVSLKLEKLKKNWKFILTILIGVGTGIILAAKVLGYLFEAYKVPTNFFFMGLMLGSLPMIWKEATSEKKATPINIIPFILGAAAIVGITFISGVTNNIQTQLTPSLFIYLVIALAISAAAMIIPGISGSLVMTILGAYATVMEAINNLNIPILIPIAIGVGVGLLGGAKIISILLKKWRQTVYFIIIGLIIGSLYTIFPTEFAFNAQGVIAIGVFLAGITIPTLMELPNKKRN